MKIFISENGRRHFYKIDDTVYYSDEVVLNIKRCFLNGDDDFECEYEAKNIIETKNLIMDNELSGFYEAKEVPHKILHYRVDGDSIFFKLENLI